MLGKSIRGGIPQAAKRYAKGNNKYIKEQYNPGEKNTYLQCFGSKNLYKWEMIQKLLKHGFSWEKVEDFTTKNK